MGRHDDDGWTTNPDYAALRNIKEDEGRDYEVGYKKPPKHSQFQPGRSGNPKGRRRKQKGPRQLLEDALNEAATIMENGKSKVLSKKQIVFKVLVASAIKGNSKAMSAVFKLMNDYGITDELEPSMKEMIIKFVRPGDKKD